MNFKRFNGTTWDAIHHKTYDTMTESLERTANLADASAVTQNLLTEDGQVNSNGNYRLTPYFENRSGLCIGIEALKPNAGQVRVGIYDQNQVFVERRLYTRNMLPIVIAPSDAAYIRVNWSVESYDTETIMINAGSTALPFVPYGFKLQASGDPLTDYTIYGNTGGVGDKTKNLFNGTVEQGSFSVATDGGEYYTTTRVRTSGIVVSEAGTYTISAAGVDQVVIYVYDLNGNFKLAESDVSWGACPESMSFNADRLVRFVFRYPDDSNITPSDVWNIMFCKSGEALPYEPYGYVIPVTSGGVITNLYLDAPLDAGDMLTYTDTGIALPTVDGDNTITFGTTVQPSAMSATFKGWHPVDAPKTYDGNNWR